MQWDLRTTGFAVAKVRNRGRGGDRTLVASIARHCEGTASTTSRSGLPSGHCLLAASYSTSDIRQHYPSAC